MLRLTVIGIGSAFADDRAGWSVVESLAASGEIADYGERILVTACGSPASELLGLLANTDVAILVDAVRFSGAPGTVYRLAGAYFPITATKFISSHGVDLPTLLALTATLEHSPRMMIIYGIEAGAGFATNSTMCQSVCRAVERVAEEIKRDIANHCVHK